MALPGRHTSLWSTDVEPPTFPALRGERVVDVVVVGGGITGITTALMSKEAGLSVAVLEADRVASGTTGGTTGKVTSQHDLFYATAVEELGEEAARVYADANQWTLGAIEGLAHRHGIDARATRLPSHLYTRDPSMVGQLSAEVEAARRLGLPASFVDEVGLPFPVAGAVRFDDQLQVHPVRLVHGLARAVDGDGSSVHEHSRVLDVSEHGDTVQVETEHGTVQARHGVVATLLPILDRGFEFARTRPHRTYGIAVALGTAPPEPMYLSAESPKRSLRHYHGDDGTYLVVVGESHETGHGEDLDGHYQALIDFAAEHFDVRSITHRWSSQDYVPVDGIPYIGPLSFTDRIQVATGFKKWGLSNGVVAAGIMADAILGHDNPWAHVFDSNRTESLPRSLELVRDNAHVAQRFLADHALLSPRAEVEELGSGEGVVVRADGRPVAVSRDDDGQLQAVEGTCTHMACVVDWNDAESSWDCPCHGSRFAPSGRVLTGPATRPLAPTHVPREPRGES